MTEYNGSVWPRGRTAFGKTSVPPARCAAPTDRQTNATASGKAAAGINGTFDRSHRVALFGTSRKPGLRSSPASTSFGLSGYTGQSVLVTGAGGTIGRELARQLVAAGPARIVLLDQSELALYDAERTLEPLAKAHGVTLVAVLGSVCDQRLVAALLGATQIDVILHAAAYKHVPLVEQNPRAGIANNTIGTAVLARLARAAGVGRFVLVSTDKAVRPVSVMGASKRLAEMVVQDLASRAEATCFATVRFGNVHGSSGSVVPLFREQVARGGPVTLTHEAATRYFMSVEAAAGLVLAAGAAATSGDLLLLDMGAPVLIGDLAREIAAAAGRTLCDPGRRNGDIPVRITGLRPGERLHEVLTTAPDSLREVMPGIWRADEKCLSQIEVAAALRDLREILDTGSEAALLSVVRRWIAADPACADAVTPSAPDSADARQ